MGWFCHPFSIKKGEKMYRIEKNIYEWKFSKKHYYKIFCY